jgi:hypothetical protein
MSVMLFGELVTILSMLSKKDSEEQTFIDSANGVMNTIGLTKNLQDDIRGYFAKTKQTKNSQKMFDNFLEMIAPSLKLKIQNQIYIIVLKTNPVISSIVNFERHEKQKMSLSEEKKGKFANIIYRSKSLIHKIRKTKQFEPPALHNEKDANFWNNKLHRQMSFNEEFVQRNDFLEIMISKLGTALTIPEEDIFYRLTMGDEMFLIIKGDCVAQLFDKNETHV